jgi:hypothetical protein
LCLFRLLDREGNPLEEDAADDSAEWDEGGAHAFFAPLAQLLGAAPPGFLGHLSLQKIRTNALAAAQAPKAASGNEGALPGVLTVLALLELCASASGGAGDALRGLARRDGALRLQRGVTGAMRRYRAMARAVAALELHPDKDIAQSK